MVVPGMVTANIGCPDGGGNAPVDVSDIIPDSGKVAEDCSKRISTVSCLVDFILWAGDGISTLPFRRRRLTSCKMYLV